MKFFLLTITFREALDFRFYYGFNDEFEKLYYVKKICTMQGCRTKAEESQLERVK